MTDFCTLASMVVETGLGTGAEGGAQVIQQVGHDDEQHRLAAAHDVVSDGGCKVGLAAAVRAGEQQPAFGMASEIARLLKGAAQVLAHVLWQTRAIGQERVEGHVAKLVEIAAAHDLRLAARGDLAGAAYTWNGPPKVGVADRQVAHDESRSQADRAVGGRVQCAVSAR